ncbi:MAG: ribonuclease E/G [SAR116 cluster bacterium]|nr:MAG: ribonuclease E/G [SAR116 cluster bacterium]
MTKRLLIDARQPEETRVVLLSGTRIEDFDYEAKNRRQLKGNVYLARVTRVEPSLQAAFVEYGGNRQGFLAFSEIHPDYYRIPVEDREALIEAENAENAEDESEAEADGAPETVGGDGQDYDDIRPRRQVRKYKIQEVISRKQIMLVQVVKEERGNKGAALTTYLSLAGRYCVLMPNSSRGGGVSRKITNIADRKRLKTVVGGLDVPAGMAVIVRTAGAKRTKAEIARDYAYLSKLWDDIRSRTLESQAPSVIHEEGNLIKRSIRDLYTSEVEEILVDGEDAYKTARTHMKMLIPSHVKKVQKYEGDQPVFQRYGAENQMETIHSPQVTLKSGGYLVINQTEALVAVDVNSGRSTRERNIEETALKTNLEAADELARQLRLRDLSGLIVVDFIDMEENRNQNAVERRMKEAMRNDRARIQIGSISHFGLLEMSRQRLRLSFNESISNLCPHCEGTGRVRSIETAAMQMLRIIEEEAQKGKMDELHVTMHRDVALFILNHKRTSVAELEARYGVQIVLSSDDSLIAPDYRVERVGWQGKKPQAANNNRRAKAESSTASAASAESDGETTDAVASEEDTPSDDEQPKRRKRGRRGGRRRRRRGGEGDNNQNGAQATESDTPADDTAKAADQNDGASAPDQASDGDADAKPAKAARGGRGRGRRAVKSDDTGSQVEGETTQSSEAGGSGDNDDSGESVVADASTAPTDADTAGDAKSAKPKGRTRKKAAPKTAPETADNADNDVAVDAAGGGEEDAPKRARKKAPAAKTGTAKKAKKAAAKKTARKKAAPKSAAADSAGERAPVTSEKVADETQRAPISSAPQDVIEVGEAKPQGRKRGWWNRG